MMRFGSLVAASLGGVLAVVACSSSNDDGGAKPTDDGGVTTDGGTTTDSGSSSSSSSSGSSGTVDSGPPPNVTITKQSLQVNGKERTYLLAVPTQYDGNRSYPLVMVFHGNPGTAEGMAQILPFDIASKQDAIIAYPNGLGNNWDLSTPPDTNEDIAFIRVLTDAIAGKVNLDKGRIFASGYSGGGFFLNQMTCRVPSVFKAFASHAGGAPFNMSGENAPADQCHPCPAGPIPSIHTHGRQDTEVGAESGYYAAACWSQTNQCGNSDPNNWTDTTPAPCKKASGCQAPVTLCWVDNQGHGQWPEATNVSWDFFRGL